MMGSLPILAVNAALVSAAGTAGQEDQTPAFGTREWQALVAGTEEWSNQFAVDLGTGKFEPPPVAEPERPTVYTVTFKGEIAGFKVGRVELSVAVSDDAYSVQYELHQAGIARWFSDAEARAKARGSFVNGEIHSHYYLNHDYESDDDQQYVELYRPGGDRRLHLWSDPQYTMYEGVDEEMALGAYDPMAAVLALGILPAKDASSPCDRQAKVFDGRRRFNLILKDAGKEWIPKGGKHRFEGLAYKCKLEQEKVGGYRAKDKGDVEGDVWVYLVEVPEEFRTKNFAYIPVMARAKTGIFTARGEGKRPIITAPDGRTINLGDLPRQRRPRGY